jgi:sphinganine-1-phosphate aldolase
MTKKGWSLNSLQSPACVHLCVTRCHVGKDKLFLDDLRAVTEEVIRIQDEGGQPAEGSAAIYGMTGGLPAGPVVELLREYNDCLLDVNP